MLIASQKIKWCPFSIKHKKYIRNAYKNKMSVAEGSVRSGKTIDHCIIASMYLEECQDRIHLASGSTIANAKLNIGDCNGFGLEHLFRGRCKWGKYKDNDALYIKTKTGDKVVVFAGGGKADSYKKILGNSYGLWIATEINEHYDCDNSKESFVKVALARQIASIQPKVLWDLNPSNPNSKIYTDYIDKFKKGLEGGYNYEHFTIYDNLAVSEQRRKEIESMYDKNSVWYRRDILGERCVAEGLIYQLFADTPDKYLIDDLNNYKIDFIQCGVDFGGNGSLHSFTATAFCNHYKDIVVLKSKRVKPTNPIDLNREFVLFIQEIYSKYQKFMIVRCDSAEQVLINGMIKASYDEKLNIKIANALKIPIIDRIRFECRLLAQNRIKLLRSETKSLQSALFGAVWDNTKQNDTRLDNGTSDIDSLDSFEYSFEEHIKLFTYN